MNDPKITVLPYNNACDASVNELVIGSFGHLSSTGIRPFSTTGTLDYCLRLASVKTTLNKVTHLIIIVTRSGTYDDRREVLRLLELLAARGNFVQIALTESTAEKCRLFRLLDNLPPAPWMQQVDIRPVQELHGSTAHDWVQQTLSTVASGDSND